MAMAKSNLAHEQTVEDILASIRQVINGEDARSAPGPAGSATGSMPSPRNPASAAPPRAGGTVTAIRGSRVVTADNDAPEDIRPGIGEEAAAMAVPDDRGEIQDVIEMAIEQALGAFTPGKKQPESQLFPSAKARAPRMTAARPRVEPRPPREAPRMIEQTPRLSPPSSSPSLLSPRANAAVAASFGDLAKVLSSRGARDIDQTVEDLLRPMLKDWLEDNLPPLVERLVREEIERVSRGGR